MRPETPGFVLDASAIAEVPDSGYLFSLLRVYGDMDRPIVLPASALTVACAQTGLDPARFDDPSFTVTALHQPVVPALVYLLTDTTGGITLEDAHAAYDAASTGLVLVTADADRYAGMPVAIDIDELP